MAERTESSIHVDAKPGVVLDVIADFEAYPEWAAEVKRVSVLSEEGDGWADRVEYTLDAGVLKDTYTLDYEWDISDDGTGVVSWSLVRATVLKAMNGSYTIARDKMEAAQDVRERESQAKIDRQNRESEARIATTPINLNGGDES